jgi:hypothetical protein
MGDTSCSRQMLTTNQQYRTLLAVAEAIVSHRDLGTLFHELAGRLHLVVRFDYLACTLHWKPRNPFRSRLLAIFRSRRTLREPSGRRSAP